MITVWAIFKPIEDFMLAMLILFLLNYIFGLLADIVKGGKWQWNKSWRSFAYTGLFFLVALSVLLIGKLMHTEDKAVFCVSCICWWAIYVFGINCTRNLRDITKGNNSWHRFFAFLYYVISMEGVKKIPYFKEWQERNEE